jgi:hypothetical protein
VSASDISPEHGIMLHAPSLSLIIPRMPAMLETLLMPNIGPLFSLISHEGLSTTKVGAAGVEGEVKA